MTDQIGYRSDHMNNREWKVSIDCLRYRVTDPEMKVPYFYGYGQNDKDIALLPWRKIIFFRCSKAVLLDRVTKYRVSNKIDDGESHESVAAGLFSLQQSFEGRLHELSKHKKAYIVSFVNADGTPDEIIAEVRKICS